MPTAPVQLTNHEGLETITDWNGHTWCIAPSGREAVTMFGPANPAGHYEWDAAKALGLHIDLGRDRSSYPSSRSGPCHAEIHDYLQSRLPAAMAQRTIASIVTEFPMSGLHLAPGQ